MNNYIHTYALHNEISGNEIIPFIMQIVEPRSVVDFGCENGSWLEVFEELGVNDLLGIDRVKLDDNDIFNINIPLFQPQFKWHFYEY